MIVQNLIYEIRGQKVMLDSDLARLYQVETKVLNQAVRRNIKRFPEDFMFQLNNKEFANLKSQIVTSSWGGRSILRAFVKVREYLLMTSTVSAEVKELRSKVDLLAIGELSSRMEEKKREPQRKIGFQQNMED